MRRLKVRLADIAREAQVSPATVDRAINGRSGVHERTARKIRQAIRHLEAIADSKPSPVIRARRLNFDVLLPAGSAAFWHDMVDSLTTAGGELASRGVSVTCHRIEGFNPEALVERVLELGKTSNGLAVAALENPIVREAVNAVADRGVPVVTLVCGLSNARKTACVGLDNRATEEDFDK